MKINEKALKRVIDEWYEKQIECFDPDKKLESKASLFFMIKKLEVEK